MLVVIGAAVTTTLLYAGVGSLVGDTAGAHVGVVKLLFTATIYDLLLAPFVVPLVMALARRFDHDPITEDASGGFGTRNRSRGGLRMGLRPGVRPGTRTGISPQRGLFGRAGKIAKTTSMARGGVRR
jgi:hypothetical protein